MAALLIEQGRQRQFDVFHKQGNSLPLVFQFTRSKTPIDSCKERVIFCDVKGIEGMTEVKMVLDNCGGTNEYILAPSIEDNVYKSGSIVILDADISLHNRNYYTLIGTIEGSTEILIKGMFFLWVS